MGFAKRQSKESAQLCFFDISELTTVAWVHKITESQHGWVGMDLKIGELAGLGEDCS